MYSKETISCFFQFFKRDLFVQWQNKNNYLLNFVVIYPLKYSIALGLVQATILFGHLSSSNLGTSMFAGAIIMPMMVMAYRLAVELLFDFEQHRFIDYQISILHPRLLLLQRILFIGLCVFTVFIPFFPVIKLILGERFNTSACHWPSLYAIIFFGSFMFSAYHLLAMCVLKNSTKITNLWSRSTLPMVYLGGMFTPWYVMNDFSPLMGAIAYLNPMLYFTEGLRHSILGGGQFFSLPLCIGMMALFTCLFTMLAWRLFKRKVDHI